MTGKPDSIQYRQADIEEIIELRNLVIIQGTDRDTPYFDGDRDQTTRHFGAFRDGEVIGCLSFMLNEWQGRPAWQLRGMATHPSLQGTGIGWALLDAAVRQIRDESGVRLLWCNARSAAVGFYQKMGWKVVSNEFIIPAVGPHNKMTCEPGPSNIV